MARIARIWTIFGPNESRRRELKFEIFRTDEKTGNLLSLIAAHVSQAAAEHALVQLALMR